MGSLEKPTSQYVGTTYPQRRRVDGLRWPQTENLLLLGGATNYISGRVNKGGMAPRKHLLSTTWALLITKEGGLIRGVWPLMAPYFARGRIRTCVAAKAPDPESGAFDHSATLAQ